MNNQKPKKKIIATTYLAQPVDSVMVKATQALNDLQTKLTRTMMMDMNQTVEKLPIALKTNAFSAAANKFMQSQKEKAIVYSQFYNQFSAYRKELESMIGTDPEIQESMFGAVFQQLDSLNKQPIQYFEEFQNLQKVHDQLQIQNDMSDAEINTRLVEALSSQIVGGKLNVDEVIPLSMAAQTASIRRNVKHAHSKIKALKNVLNAENLSQLDQGVKPGIMLDDMKSDTHSIASSRMTGRSRVQRPSARGSVMGDSEIVTALGKKKRVIEDDAEEAPVAKKTKVKETELPKPIVQVAPIQAPIEEVKGDDQMQEEAQTPDDQLIPVTNNELVPMDPRSLQGLERQFNSSGGGALQIFQNVLNQVSYQAPKGRNQAVDKNLLLKDAQTFAGMQVLSSKSTGMKMQGLGVDLVNQSGIGGIIKFQDDSTAQRIEMAERVISAIPQGTSSTFRRQKRIGPNFEKQEVHDVQRSQIEEYFRTKALEDKQGFLKNDTASVLAAAVQRAPQQQRDAYRQLHNRHKAYMSLGNISDHNQGLKIKDTAAFSYGSSTDDPVENAMPILLNPQGEVIDDLNKMMAKLHEVRHEDFMSDPQYAPYRIIEQSISDYIRPQTAAGVKSILKRYNAYIGNNQSTDLGRQDASLEYLAFAMGQVKEVTDIEGVTIPAHEYVNSYEDYHVQFMNWIQSFGKPVYNVLDMTGLRLNKKAGDIDLFNKTVSDGRTEIFLSPYATRSTVPLITSGQVQYVSPLASNFRDLMKYRQGLGPVLQQINRKTANNRVQIDNDLKQAWISMGTPYSNPTKYGKFLGDLVMPSRVKKKFLTADDDPNIDLQKDSNAYQAYDPFNVLEINEQTNEFQFKDVDAEPVQLDQIDIKNYFERCNAMTYLLANATKSGLMFDIAYQDRGIKIAKQFAAVNQSDLRKKLVDMRFFPYPGEDEIDTINASHIINEKSMTRISDQLKLLLTYQVGDEEFSEREMQCVLRAGAAFSLIDTVYGEDDATKNDNLRILRLTKLITTGKPMMDEIGHQEPLFEKMIKNNFMAQGGIPLLINYTKVVLDSMAQDMLASQVGPSWKTDLEKYTSGSFFQKQRGTIVRPHVFGVTQHPKLMEGLQEMLQQLIVIEDAAVLDKTAIIPTTNIAESDFFRDIPLAPNIYKKNVTRNLKTGHKLADIDATAIMDYPQLDIAKDFLRAVTSQYGSHIRDLQAQDKVKMQNLNAINTVDKQKVIEQIDTLKQQLTSLGLKAQENDIKNQQEKAKITQNVISINYVDGSKLRKQMVPLQEELDALETKYGPQGMYLQQMSSQQESDAGRKKITGNLKKASQTELGGIMLDALDKVLQNQLVLNEVDWKRHLSPYFSTKVEKDVLYQTDDDEAKALSELEIATAPSATSDGMSSVQSRIMQNLATLNNEEMGYCYQCFSPSRIDGEKISFMMCCGLPIHPTCFKIDYQLSNPGQKIPGTQLLCGRCNFGPTGFVNVPQNSIRNIREYFGQDYKPMEEAAAFSERVATMGESLKSDLTYNAFLYQQSIDEGYLKVPRGAKNRQLLFNYQEKGRLLPISQQKVIEPTLNTPEQLLEKYSVYDRPLQYVLGNIVHSIINQGENIPYRLDEMTGMSEGSLSKLITTTDIQQNLYGGTEYAATGELVPMKSRITQDQFRFVAQNFFKDFYSTLEEKQAFQIMPMLSQFGELNHTESGIQGYRPERYNQGISNLRMNLNGRFGSEMMYYDDRAPLLQIQDEDMIGFRQQESIIQNIQDEEIKDMEQLQDPVMIMNDEILNNFDDYVNGNIPQLPEELAQLEDQTQNAIMLSTLQQEKMTQQEIDFVLAGDIIDLPPLQQAAPLQNMILQTEAFVNILNPAQPTQEIIEDPSQIKVQNPLEDNKMEETVIQPTIVEQAPMVKQKARKGRVQIVEPVQQEQAPAISDMELYSQQMHEKRFGELMRQSVDEITNLKLANRTLELERDRLITDREKYLQPNNNEREAKEFREKYESTMKKLQLVQDSAKKFEMLSNDSSQNLLRVMEEKKRFEQEAAKSRDDIDQLRQQLSSTRLNTADANYYRQEKDKLDLEIAKLRTEYNNVRDDKNKYSLWLSSAEQQRDKAISDKTMSEGQLTMLNTTIASKQKQLEETNRQLQAKDQAISTHNAKIAALTNERDANKYKIQELESKIAMEDSKYRAQFSNSAENQKLMSKYEQSLQIQLGELKKYGAQLEQDKIRFQLQGLTDESKVKEYVSKTVDQIKAQMTDVYDRLNMQSKTSMELIQQLDTQNPTLFQDFKTHLKTGKVEVSQTNFKDYMQQVAPSMQQHHLTVLEQMRGKAEADIKVWDVKTKVIQDIYKSIQTQQSRFSAGRVGTAPLIQRLKDLGKPNLAAPIAAYEKGDETQLPVLESLMRQSEQEQESLLRNMQSSMSSIENVAQKLKADMVKYKTDVIQINNTFQKGNEIAQLLETLGNSSLAQRIKVRVTSDQLMGLGAEAGLIARDFQGVQGYYQALSEAAQWIGNQKSNLQESEVRIKDLIIEQTRIAKIADTLKQTVSTQINKANDATSQIFHRHVNLLGRIDPIPAYGTADLSQIVTQMGAQKTQLEMGGQQMEALQQKSTEIFTQVERATDYFKANLGKMQDSRNKLIAKIESFRTNNMDLQIYESRVNSRLGVEPGFQDKPISDQVMIVSALPETLNKINGVIQNDLTKINESITRSEHLYQNLQKLGSDIQAARNQLFAANKKSRDVVNNFMTETDQAFAEAMNKIAPIKTYLSVSDAQQIPKTVLPSELPSFFISQKRVLNEELQQASRSLEETRVAIADLPRKMTEQKEATAMKAKLLREHDKRLREVDGIVVANTMIDEMTRVFQGQLELFRRRESFVTNAELLDLFVTAKNSFDILGENGLQFSLPFNSMMAGSVGQPRTHPELMNSIKDYIYRSSRAMFEEQKRLREVGRDEEADELRQKINMSAKREDGKVQLIVDPEQDGEYIPYDEIKPEQLRFALSDKDRFMFDPDFAFQTYLQFHDQEGSDQVGRTYDIMKQIIQKNQNFKVDLSFVSTVPSLRKSSQVLNDQLDKITRSSIYATFMSLSAPTVKIRQDADDIMKRVFTEEQVQIENFERATFRNTCFKQLENNLQAVSEIYPLVQDMSTIARQVDSVQKYTYFQDPKIVQQSLQEGGTLQKLLESYENLLVSTIKPAEEYAIGSQSSSFKLVDQQSRSLLAKSKEVNSEILKYSNSLVKSENMSTIKRHMEKIASKYNLQLDPQGANMSEAIYNIKQAFDKNLMDSYIRSFRLDRGGALDRDFVDRASNDFVTLLQSGNLAGLDEAKLPIENMRELLKLMKAQFPDSVMQAFKRSIFDNGSNILARLDDQTILNLIGQEQSAILRSIQGTADDIYELSRKRKEQQKGLKEKVPELVRVISERQVAIRDKISEMKYDLNLQRAGQPGGKLPTDYVKRAEDTQIRQELSAKRDFNKTIYGLGQTFERHKPGTTLLEDAFAQQNISQFSKLLGQAGNMNQIQEVMKTANTIKADIKKSRDVIDDSKAFDYDIQPDTLNETLKGFLMRQLDVTVLTPDVRQSAKNVLGGLSSAGDRMLLSAVVFAHADKTLAERQGLFTFQSMGNEGSIIPHTQIQEAQAELVLIKHVTQQMQEAGRALSVALIQDRPKKIDHIRHRYGVTHNQATIILNQVDDMTGLESKGTIVVLEYEAMINHALKANEILMDHDMDIMQQQIESIQFKMDGFDQQAQYNRAVENIQNKFKAGIENIMVKTGLQDAMGEEEKNDVRRAADNMFPRINHGRGQGIGGSYVSGQQQQNDPRRPMIGYQNSPAMQQQMGNQQGQQQQDEQDKDGKGLSKRVIDVAQKTGKITKQDINFLKQIKTDPSGKFVLSLEGGETRELTKEEKKRLIKLIIMIMVLMYISLYGITDKQEEESTKRKIESEVDKNKDKGSRLMSTLDKLAGKYLQQVKENAPE